MISIERFIDYVLSSVMKCFVKHLNFPLEKGKLFYKKKGKVSCVTYKVNKGSIRSLIWCEHVTSVTCDTWEWHSRHLSLTQQPSDRYDDRELG